MKKIITFIKESYKKIKELINKINTFINKKDEK